MPRVGLVISPIEKPQQRDFSELLEMLKMGSGFITGDVVSRGDLGKGSKQESRKGAFKRLARSVLKEISKLLGVCGKISFNASGPAASGEASLTTFDGLLLVFSPSIACLECLGILYRFGNGPNNWLPLSRIRCMDDVIRCLHDLRVRNQCRK